jgi:DNA polymerase
VVFGVGSQNAKIMFVGEGPGEQEDLRGEPFVGPAGQLLDDMLSIIDLSRKENCYIANIVKCRPPYNRDPKENEQDACIGYLYEQMELVQPKIIVCLGRIAATRLIRSDFRITREHGTWTERGGIWFTATYHPSALLRDASKRPDAFEDLLAIREKIRETQSKV